MPSLTQYAEEILTCAKRLDGHLASEGLPTPSFDEDVFTTLPPELKNTLSSLINTSNTLKQLAEGTIGISSGILLSWTDVVSLRVIYHYKLAHAVPLTGTTTYDAIAAASGLSPLFTQRFIRHAIQNHIFAETSPGQVRHTALSRRLVEDPDFYDAVGLETDEMAPASTRIIDALEAYGDSGEQHETAYSLYNGTPLSIFGFLARHPERGRRFSAGMRNFAKGEAWGLRHLLSSFDWAAFDRPGVVVVDVGGGHGSVSQFLARNTEHVHFVVQDLPETVEQGRELQPRELADRVEFVAHDFFTPQAVPKVDMFFVRWIFHNWSDKYCVKILRNFVPALKEGVRVVLYEDVLPDVSSTNRTEKMGLDVDMIMATCFAGRERRARDWERPFEEADSRFALKQITKPEGSSLAVIEVSWQV